MMTVSRLSLLNTALDLSKDMLVAAKENSWKDIAEKETQRETLIKQVFSSTIEDKEVSKVMLMVKEILAYDQELVSLGMLEKKSYANNIIALKRDHRASNAYYENNKL